MALLFDMPIPLKNGIQTPNPPFNPSISRKIDKVLYEVNVVRGIM
jgi:hypothetical protein